MKTVLKQRDMSTSHFEVDWKCANVHRWDVFIVDNAVGWKAFFSRYVLDLMPLNHLPDRGSSDRLGVCARCSFPSVWRVQPCTVYDSAEGFPLTSVQLGGQAHMDHTRMTFMEHLSADLQFLGSFFVWSILRKCSLLGLFEELRGYDTLGPPQCGLPGIRPPPPPPHSAIVKGLLCFFGCWGGSGLLSCRPLHFISVWGLHSSREAPIPVLVRLIIYSSSENRDKCQSLKSEVCWVTSMLSSV